MLKFLQKTVLAAATGVALLASTGAAIAADWPKKTIQMVVPFPAGSSPDVLARTIAEPMSQALGQTIIVDNKPGAGGNIGTRFVARAKPDGYTLLLTINGPMVTAPTLYKKSLGYDPLKDLQPISLVGTSPNVLIVPADSPATNLTEFIELAKKEKGALNYGSVGAGSASHLSMAMLEHAADIELTHIPYSGFPQIISGVIAGDIHGAFMVPGIAMPQVNSGKIRALAVTSLEESELVPNMPPVAATKGFEGFEAISWDALFVPSGTPEAIVTRLNELTQEVLARPEVQEKIRALYFTPESSSPAAMTERIQSEKVVWDEVIERLQLTLD
ncbi:MULTISPECIES: Bug family tripartite tricarboxylate transporter substrate binding protein [Paenalcaligenes]|uniref:Tripartite tricarboxylate transporter substrate binding protein n=1 Tax=Paenalcaligenes hermetiae TaxID=1157987 RepID=A0ABP9LSG1_9BURK|nr:tripartite tricarboxylate transporter substrate binding protein [Paenalcaligenes sp.]